MARLALPIKFAMDTASGVATGQAIVDTGAEVTILTESFAKRHHLPLTTSLAKVRGISGVPMRLSTTPIWEFDLPEVSDCSIKGSPYMISVADLPDFGHGISMLLGEDLMKQLGLKIEFTEEGALLSCRRGPKTFVPASQAFGVGSDLGVFLAIGGVLVAGVVIAVLVS